MNQPDTLNQMIYPFADYPFKKKRSDREDIIVKRQFRLPLPSQTIDTEMQIRFCQDVRRGAEIMPLAPTSGYRIGKVDLQNFKRRTAKIGSSIRRYSKFNQPFFPLSVNLDFSEAIAQEQVQLEYIGKEANGVFYGDDAEYMSRLRCGIYANGTYESQGLDLIQGQTENGQSKFEINDGYYYLSFEDFYPLETGPLLANWSYNWANRDGVGTGYAHALGFQYTPRYFKQLSELGIILYQTDQNRVPL